MWTGPSTRKTQFQARKFIRECRDKWPSGGLSLGWTVGGRITDFVFGDITGMYIPEMADLAIEDIGASAGLPDSYLGKGKFVPVATATLTNTNDRPAPESLPVSPFITFALHAMMTKYSPEAFLRRVSLVWCSFLSGLRLAFSFHHLPTHTRA